MTFLAGDRVIDESKARGYYVGATAAAVGDVRGCERALRELLLPGQRRLHFKRESDSRRRQILSRMCAVEVRVGVWVVRQLPDREARPLSLGSLVDAAARAGVGQLLIERDVSLESADRRLIAEMLRGRGATSLEYRHAAPHEHPPLWVSDAVAWCYSNGGDWTREAEPEAQLILVSPHNSCRNRAGGEVVVLCRECAGRSSRHTPGTDVETEVRKRSDCGRLGRFVSLRSLNDRWFRRLGHGPKNPPSSGKSKTPAM